MKHQLGKTVECYDECVLNIVECLEFITNWCFAGSLNELI